MHPARNSFAAIALAISLACSSESTADTTASISSLVHLDLELARARVTTAAAPDTAREQRMWGVKDLADQWKPISSLIPGRLAAVELVPQPDCLRMNIVEPAGIRGSMLMAGIFVEVPETPIDAWTGLLVRARSHARMSGMGAACNVDASGNIPHNFAFFGGGAGTAPVFNDGSVQDYMLPLVTRDAGGEKDDGERGNAGKPGAKPARTIHSVGLFASAPQAATLEILSITLVARGAD